MDELSFVRFFSFLSFWYFCFWRAILIFLGPVRLFSGLDWGPISFFGFYSYRLMIFILWYFLFSDFLFFAFSGHFSDLLGYFRRLGLGPKSFFRCTHIDWYRLMTFICKIFLFNDFQIFCILGSFWDFLGPTGLFLEVGLGPRSFLGPTHIDW